MNTSPAGGVNTTEARMSSMKWNAHAGILPGEENADCEEFDARVVENERRIFQIAYGVLGDAADAEDVAQDAFIRAWRRRRSLREREKFSAWVGRITFRLALNRRKARRRQVVRDTRWHVARTAGAANAAGQAEQRLHLAQLRVEIDRLPGKLRAVLLLAAVEGLDSREIASILRVPAGTVRSRLHAARRRLLEATE